MSFADGTAENRAGKRVVRGWFFSSNLAKRAGFCGKKQVFQGFVFTDKDMVMFFILLILFYLSRFSALKTGVYGVGGGGYLKNREQGIGNR